MCLVAMHLVKSGDDLYLIRKCRFGWLGVLKLDKELGKWVCFTDWLIDRVMLEDGGFYHGEFGGAKNNCFYFMDLDCLACLTFPTATPTSK